jgi:hypothetical protein
MTEPEPVIHEAAAVPAAEPTANGSNGPRSGGEEPPLAAVAPPPAEPVIVSPPLNESVIISPPVSEPFFQMAAAATCPAPPELSLEPVPAKSAEVEALEDRLRRLESVLTNLADTQQLEERLAERLSKRADQSAPLATAATAPVATAATAPVATPAPVIDQPAKPNVIVEAGRRWLPSLGGRAPGAASAGDSRPAASASWLLLDILREFQAILHMYGDPRYRLTWSGRILPVVFLALIATSGFWTYPLTGWMPTLLGNLVLKAIDLVPAFCLFKVLSREARRYRATIPQYPSSPS